MKCLNRFLILVIRTLIGVFLEKLINFKSKNTQNSSANIKMGNIQNRSTSITDSSCNKDVDQRENDNRIKSHFDIQQISKPLIKNSAQKSIIDLLDSRLCVPMECRQLNKTTVDAAVESVQKFIHEVIYEITNQQKCIDNAGASILVELKSLDPCIIKYRREVEKRVQCHQIQKEIKSSLQSVHRQLDGIMSMFDEIEKFLDDRKND
ncbi:hypothetical protein GJ496_011977 [Pomphorhynchus laevis]|nr:hypothetical protein GJ496_011977 [Pomphorhynchus laevis]